MFREVSSFNYTAFKKNSVHTCNKTRPSILIRHHFLLYVIGTTDFYISEVMHKTQWFSDNHKQCIYESVIVLYTLILWKCNRAPLVIHRNYCNTTL